MNREQKAAAVAEIAKSIREADAVFAVDFRGLSVPQAADLRTRLREADATFRVVKNSLTERAADDVGAASLKALLEGPTALTFVRGDAALAAKALRTFGRERDLLAFKGGLLGTEPLDPEQMAAIARLPARDILYGQLVGMVASPITGLVRGLNALIAGLAIQLGQIAEKKASGELPADEPPAAAAEEAPAPEEASDVPAITEEPSTAEPIAVATAQAADQDAEAADQDAEAPEGPAAPEEPAEGDPRATPDNDDDSEAGASA